MNAHETTTASSHNDTVAQRSVARGVLAIGDSITAACSKDLAVGGVPSRSWAEWVALSLDEPLHVYAKSGASASQVLGLLPKDLPPARIGMIFVGVNDTLSWRNWRNQNLHNALSAIIDRLSRAVERVIVVQIPSNLGQTRAPFAYGPSLQSRVVASQQAIRRACSEQQVILIESPELTGDEIWIDGVHPTSTGHLAMAGTVLAACGEEGLSTAHGPRETNGRADFHNWKRQQHLRFAVNQPLRSMAAFIFHRRPTATPTPWDMR